MKSTWLLLPIIFGVLGGCSRSSFDPRAEESTLLKRDAEWAAAAAAGHDVEKIVSYWTDDALVVPPGQPAIEGKAAIRQFVTQSLKIPDFRIHWVSTKATFSPDGQLAYMRGVNETRMRGSDGRVMTMRGRGVTIWRRDKDGQWRCAVDIWNEPPVSSESIR